MQKKLLALVVSGVLAVPSVVVPAESNFVIRAHAEAVEIVAVERFEFDRRLWAAERVEERQVFTSLDVAFSPSRLKEQPS